MEGCVPSGVHHDRRRAERGPGGRAPPPALEEEPGATSLPRRDAGAAVADARGDAQGGCWGSGCAGGLGACPDAVETRHGPRWTPLLSRLRSPPPVKHKIR